MKAHDIQPKANYVNWIGRTVKQVYEEAALHRCLAAKLQEIILENGKEELHVIRQKLLAHVELEKHAGKLSLSPPEPTPFCWRLCNCLHLIGIPLILLALSPILLLIAPFFFIGLRLLESSDPELDIRPDGRYIQQLSAQEDWYVSNQYNVFGDVKPGIFAV